MNKRTLQFIIGIVFVLALLGFISYAVNQLQLNKDSKIIIDSNNMVIDSFSKQFEDSSKVFKGIDSLKLEEAKQKELNTLADGYASQIENSKNQLKPGINSPSNNNFKLAASKLDGYKERSKELKDILENKVCIKTNFGEYLTTISLISSIQEEVARSSSFESSKTALTNLRSSYQTLIAKAKLVEECFKLESLKDLKQNILDSETADSESIAAYQTNYLDPLMALYVGEDYTKIGAFIDANSAVTVKLKLPSLFENSFELSIVDKILEDQIDSAIGI
ncbi:MAG: hypothetical protein ABIM99_06125 [Candidatus Dojkabacteria bacterium]